MSEKEAGPSAEGPGGNQGAGGRRFTVESTDQGRRDRASLIASKRRISRQLDEVIDRLDGSPAIELPDVGGRCPGWCRAMDRSSLDYWAEQGHCPCPAARAAVAS